MDESKYSGVEYKFLRLSNEAKAPKKRKLLIVILAVFQLLFLILYGIFGKYDAKTTEDNQKLYPAFMDVHSMMFVGFGFLMTFLKRYGYSSISYNFIIAAFVLEWAVLVRGFIHGMSLNVQSILVSDFCAAAVLISFGAVLGKTSLIQLIVMSFVEVAVQILNETFCVEYLKVSDVGGSIFVHVFGAFFGLAVAKVINTKKVEDPNHKEGSNYHSDLFSMIGTIFLWIYWPSFNSAVAVGAGQNRAIVNTVLSLSASVMSTFIVSIILDKRKLNMVHVQNATLAGGVAVGAVADLMIGPVGAIAIGTLSGILSVVGYEIITPFLKKLKLHDTCGVNNLHGLPGVFSGLASVLFAYLATSEAYTTEGLVAIYGARSNETELLFAQKPIDFVQISNRTGGDQAKYQMIALLLTLVISITSGTVTGLIMRLPIFEKVDEENMFDDESAFVTPEEYSLKLAEIKLDK